MIFFYYIGVLNTNNVVESYICACSPRKRVRLRDEEEEEEAARGIVIPISDRLGGAVLLGGGVWYFDPRFPICYGDGQARTRCDVYQNIISLYELSIHASPRRCFRIKSSKISWLS